MNSQNTLSAGSAELRLADYPALSHLRLGAEDLAVLRRQGSVVREVRGAAVYFRLSFRRNDGRQVMRYIGGPSAAEAVRRELAQLQSERKTELRLSALCRQACKMLGQAKAALEPEVTRHGLAYHGQQIRRRRTPKHGS